MYKNLDLSPKERARDLLSKMTLDEKIAQMAFFYSLKNLANDVKSGADLLCQCGVFGNLSHLADENAFDQIQEYFVNRTRFGIPLLMTFESLHGLYHSKATVFPQCAGMGGSFDPALIEEMAQLIGLEARAVGVRQVLAPNVDIPRDPRWGRMQEAYGEDPYLVGEMGAAYVRGVQKMGVAATAKHYLAYGVPEGGINLAPAHIGEREIREVMLEPFARCIDAGVMSVMPSYNEIDGQPLHASKKYLRDILRDELGFEGTTIADWGGVRMLHEFQRVAENYLAAGKMSLVAGVDIEAPDAVGYNGDFKAEAKNGGVDLSLIDQAVERILTLKFQLGLFEDPYARKDLVPKMHSNRAIELSRRLDEESILLLKNDGILPLDEKKIGKIAIIGNNAKNSFLGDYIDRTEHCIDFLSGMTARLGSNRVLYARGCNPISCDDEMIEEAIETAKQADVVFLVLGDSTDTGGGVGGGAFKNTEITCGEGYDAHELSFPPSQKRLFDAIAKIGKPIVLVLYAGRPYTVMNQVEHVNGFLFSFGGGEQSGVAFANLIFGDKSPCAKLAFSMPQSVGHLPCYYNHKASARGYYKRHGSPQQPGRDYVLSSPLPWYPFGYGLSYTTLAYSDLVAKVNENGTVNVSVCVENIGNYAINESVLCFVKMLYCPVTPFEKKLRRFKKVHLNPGEKKTVTFLLDDGDFTYVDENMKTVKNKGTHQILIDSLQASIEV